MPRPFFQPLLVLPDDLHDSLILNLHGKAHCIQTSALASCTIVKGLVSTHLSGESNWKIAPAVFRFQALLLEEPGLDDVLWTRADPGLAMPDMV